MNLDVNYEKSEFYFFNSYLICVHFNYNQHLSERLILIRSFINKYIYYFIE